MALGLNKIKKNPHGRKITPGKPIESLEGPCSSQISSSLLIAKKNWRKISVAHIKKGKPTTHNSGKVKDNSKLEKGQE